MHDTEIQIAARKIADVLQGRPADKIEQYLADAEVSLLCCRHQVETPAAAVVVEAVRCLSAGCALSAIKQARDLIVAEAPYTPSIYFIHGISKRAVEAA